MKRQFYCETCESIFEANGKKQNLTSKLFGPTWKYVASCPNCENEAGEYKPVSMSKKGGAGLSNSVPSSCSTGTCPFATN